MRHCNIDSYRDHNDGLNGVIFYALRIEQLLELLAESDL